MATLFVLDIRHLICNNLLKQWIIAEINQLQTRKQGKSHLVILFLVEYVSNEGY